MPHRQHIEAAITKETVGRVSTTSQCSESHKDLNATLAPAWRDWMNLVSDQWCRVYTRSLDVKSEMKEKLFEKGVEFYTRHTATSLVRSLHCYGQSCMSWWNARAFSYKETISINALIIIIIYCSSLIFNFTPF